MAPQARGPGLAPAWYGRAGRSPGGAGGAALAPPVPRDGLRLKSLHSISYQHLVQQNLIPASKPNSYEGGSLRYVESVIPISADEIPTRIVTLDVGTSA